ncbi:Nn.00g071230.m01.CDS01 [Neocucurbitaria sp. VM-36]
MEALSGVASGMAVVSLSIQLIQSVDKIKTLIRNVKGAPTELARLTELLIRLTAMLRDVCNLLERQSSLHMHVKDFPTASPTILTCLQSCENTLQALEVLLGEVQKTHDGTTMTQLRKGIRIGLKTKDIAALELRLQHEINFLQTALNTNTATVLVNVLPAILKNQQINALTHSHEPQLVAVTQSIYAGSNPSEHEVSRNPPYPRFSRRTIEMDSPLRILGVRQRKTIRYICSPANQQDRKLLDYRKDIISEEDEYVISWKLLGLGMRLSRGGPYSRIIPSLKVYPIVSGISTDLFTTFDSGKLQDIQKMFVSGAVHPFMQEKRSGFSLLHLAAYFGRADVYSLLLEYGLKPDSENFRQSVTVVAMAMRGTQSSSNIEIYRLLLPELVHIEDFRCGIWSTVPCSDNGVHDMWWLWQQSQHYLFGQELFDFRVVLVRAVLKYLAREQCKRKWEATFQTWVNVIQKEFLDKIEQGSLQLLSSLWSYSSPAFGDSSCEGPALIGVLSRLGVNAQICIKRELKALEDNILKDAAEVLPHKQIIFDQAHGGDWTLRWEWTYEAYGSSAPVDTVFSQYEAIATTFGLLEWPFLKGRLYNDRMIEIPGRNARFQRRMTAKARKERARAGQKQPRGKIPGSWIFS